MRATFRIILLAILVPIGLFTAGIALVYVHGTWTHRQRITVQACYQQYACEGCLHMKVTHVDDVRFADLIDQDIRPYSTHIDVADYIGEHHQRPVRPFMLSGYLHRFRHNLPGFALAPDAYDFRVEQIHYLTHEFCP